MSNASSCGSELYRPYAPSFPIVTSRGVSSEDTLIERRNRHQAPSYFQFKSPNKTTGGEDPERRNKDVEGAPSWSWWHQPTRPVDPNADALRYLAPVDPGEPESTYPFSLSSWEIECLLGHVTVPDEQRLAFIDLRERYVQVEEQEGYPREMVRERATLDELIFVTFREQNAGIASHEDLAALVNIASAFYALHLGLRGLSFDPSSNFLQPQLPLGAMKEPSAKLVGACTDMVKKELLKGFAADEERDQPARESKRDEVAHEIQQLAEVIGAEEAVGWTHMSTEPKEARKAIHPDGEQAPTGHTSPWDQYPPNYDAKHRVKSSGKRVKCPSQPKVIDREGVSIKLYPTIIPGKYWHLQPRKPRRMGDAKASLRREEDRARALNAIQSFGDAGASLYDVRKHAGLKHALAVAAVSSLVSSNLVRAITKGSRVRYAS